MKLKEIKPGMVIHYKNDEEKKLLLEELERLGYVWYNSYTLPTKRVKDSAIGAVIHVCDKGYKHITHSMQGKNVTHEFSDLILPELSAEEVLEIRNKLEFDFVRKYLGLAYGPSLDEMLRKATVEQVMDMCERWKTTQEKKKPETEWVDVCRIIQIHENGTKKCVYEEEIKPDEDLPYGGEKLEAERIFKKYISEHGGNYIAVVEPICRVKGE